MRAKEPIACEHRIETGAAGRIRKEEHSCTAGEVSSGRVSNPGLSRYIMCAQPLVHLRVKIFGLVLMKACVGFIVAYLRVNFFVSHHGCDRAFSSARYLHL